MYLYFTYFLKHRPLTLEMKKPVYHYNKCLAAAFILPSKLLVHFKENYINKTYFIYLWVFYFYANTSFSERVNDFSFVEDIFQLDISNS